MPFYQRLGDVPRKRHVQFRENGTLLTEEVMGLEGFTGNESILYHLQSPCRVMKLDGFEPIERKEWVPDQHAHRHFKTFDVRPEGDEVTGRRPLISSPSASMPYVLKCRCACVSGTHSSRSISSKSPTFITRQGDWRW